MQICRRSVGVHFVQIFIYLEITRNCSKIITKTWFSQPIPQLIKINLNSAIVEHRASKNS